MMALPVAAIAGAAATAAYLDARFHIQEDLFRGSHSNSTKKAQKYIQKKIAEDRILLYHALEDNVTSKPYNLFLEFEGRSWTYQRFFDDVQRVGNWLMNDLGVKKDEVVAIDGPNSPEYIMLSTAIEGIGAVTSFINNNLTGAALVHCAKICESRYLIAEQSTQNFVGPHVDELSEAGIRTLYFDQAFIESLPDDTPLPEERRKGISPSRTQWCDLLLIYTSGTTGLPKGVMKSTGSWINIARGMAEYLELTPADKFYTCLPLYHGAAQGLCVTPVMFAGASMRLGRKFSHKTFWNEVYESKANRLQYVGELCRYLVNAPPHPLERKHQVVEAWGNGMRPDVWEKFRQRFNIPVIHELYAATDGMGGSQNRNKGEFSRNAIGVRGLLWNYWNGGNEARAKIDPDTEDIVRNNDGYVVRAEVNEPGEVLHKVDPAMKEAAFKGYFKNDEASEKRWMKSVFEPNDLWFRSGDVMKVDSDGRVFFVDRLGDTFRWKSENVSTNEVADVIGTFSQIAETNVYGVEVPHADGRCGCAIIVLHPSTTAESLDLTALAQHVLSQLPKYAVPLFLRVSPQISYTGNFKIQKGQAKKEGIDVDLIEQSGSKDHLFWLPPSAKSYVSYRREDWEALKSGKVSL